MRKQQLSRITTWVIALATIFVVEIVVHLLFHPIISENSPLVSAALNSLVLVIGVYPILYFLLYRPLALEMTERKKIEEVLRKSEERYRTLLYSIPQKVFYKDRDSVYLAVNPSYARDFNLSPAGFVGKNDFDFFPAVLAEKYRADDRRIMESGVTEELDESYMQEGKEKTIHTLKTPVRDDQGTVVGILGIFWDITERKLAEQFRQEYISLVSHDLRAPLSIIYGQAQILQRVLEKSRPHEVERHSADAIVRSAQRMNTMIQQLVDSGRLEVGQLCMERQPVDLRSLIPDLLGRVAGTMDTGRLRVHIPAETPPVLADSECLERALTNLLSNALKYSPADTEVTVAVSEGDKMVVVSVSDHGQGISTADLPHIFDRYYRARDGKEKVEGLGLGLYITRLIAKAHGGQIWCESEVGKGSTFSFTLPLA